MRPLLEMLLVIVALATHACGLPPYRELPAQLQTQNQLAWYGDDGVSQVQSNVFPSFKENIVPQQIGQAEFNWDQSQQGTFEGYETNAPSRSQSPHNSDYVYEPDQTLQPYPNALNGLTVSCSGQNKVCVAESLCIDGYVHPLKQGFIRPGQVQECKLGHEVCCTVRYDLGNSPYDNTVLKDDRFHEYPEPSLENDQKYVPYGENNQADVSELEPLGNDAEQQSAPNDGSEIDSANQPRGDIRTPDEVPVDYNQIPADTNQQEQYQKGAVNSGAPAFPSVNPAATGPNAVFDFPVQSGCAAALLCVEEQYCTLEGVISPEPVALTGKQLLRRVPLSSCRNSKTGLVGKCCRDPNYVDPWPTGNLPANYTGGFDEQGFPTFLNIAKVRPPKKPVTQPARTIPKPPVKTPVPPPQQPTSVVPLVPEDTHVAQRVVPIPTQIPIAPSTPGPFAKNPYDSDSSNQDAVSVVPQVPQVPQVSYVPQVPYVPPVPQVPQVPYVPPVPQVPQVPYIPPVPQVPQVPYIPPVPQVPQAPRNLCGVRNYEQRPTGYRETDAAFGEIPWQAMVLWSPERRILCSGALVAPDAVLTAASCVNRFSPNELSVKLGEWKLGYELQQEEPLPFEIIDVRTIKYHPGYVEGLSSNDTAMLLLERPATFDLHVNTLCLPDDYQVQETSQCIVTGWGKSILQAHYAGVIMHMVDVDLLSREVCQNRVLGAESQINIANDIICGKAREQNNMCQADIGGPLACYDGKGAYHIAGIYSQDTGCLPTNQVATFAPIDVAWVKQIMHFPHTTESKIDIAQTGINDGYDYRKSNLPAGNEYLPPV